MDQDIKVRRDQSKTRNAKSVIGVRHGCCSPPILFNLYTKHITKEDVEGFGNFKIVQQVICSMKYADEFGLLRQNLLQGMTERLIEIGRCYGMEMNVDKSEVMRISRQPFTVLIMIYQT